MSAPRRFAALGGDTGGDWIWMQITAVIYLTARRYSSAANVRLAPHAASTSLISSATK